MHTHIQTNQEIEHYSPTKDGCDCLYICIHKNINRHVCIDIYVFIHIFTQTHTYVYISQEIEDYSPTKDGCDCSINNSNRLLTCSCGSAWGALTLQDEGCYGWWVGGSVGVWVCTRLLRLVSGWECGCVGVHSLCKTKVATACQYIDIYI